MADRSGVLIADDDTELRELVAEYLAGHGFHILQATNGLEALLCVKRERPHAVLLDINMPRLGGLEALKRIRAFAPSTRVVVYSGMLEPDVKRQAIAFGAVALFAKPAPLEDLRLALEGDMPIPPSPEMVPTVVASEAPTAPGIVRKLRILLIDDDHEVNELLGELLSLRGVETFSVTNAMDALTDSRATCAMLRSAIVTASDSGFKRIPLHAGHGLSDMYRSSSAFRYSDCVSS